MSNFVMLYNTGLLYKMIHKINIFNLNAMIFGRLVPG